MSKAAVSSLTWGIHGPSGFMDAAISWRLLRLLRLCRALGFLGSPRWRLDPHHMVLVLTGSAGKCPPILSVDRWARPAVLLVTVAFALLGYSPPILILFGVIDFAGVAWMFWALRSERTRE